MSTLTASSAMIPQSLDGVPLDGSVSAMLDVSFAASSACDSLDAAFAVSVAPYFSKILIMPL